MIDQSLEPAELEPTEPGVDTNQTTFSWEEPLFEQTAAVSDPVAATAVPRKPWYTKPLVLVIGGLSLLLVILLALVLILRPAPPQFVLPEPSASPFVSTVSDPLKLRIQQLKLELEEADPTKQDLPYPPIDPTLKLEPLK